jgi:hypothetical protein
MAQLLAALHGGWVAGETSRQTATRRAAAAAPISDEQASWPVGVAAAAGAAVAGLAAGSLAETDGGGLVAV